MTQVIDFTKRPYVWSYGGLDQMEALIFITKVSQPIQFIPLHDLYVSKAGMERLLRNKMDRDKRLLLENTLTSIDAVIRLHKEL